MNVSLKEVVYVYGPATNTSFIFTKHPLPRIYVQKYTCTKLYLYQMKNSSCFYIKINNNNLSRNNCFAPLSNVQVAKETNRS